MAERPQRNSVTQVSADEKSPSFWRRWCPSWCVYLPKFVCVHNPRLGLMNSCLSAFVFIFTIYFFVSSDKYLLAKQPRQAVSICGLRCLPTTLEMDEWIGKSLTEPYCSDKSDYRVSGENYRGITCIERCGNRTRQGSCLFPSEMAVASHDGLFIPTFYRETLMSPMNEIGCPGEGFSELPGTQVCSKTSNYYVSGAENQKLFFNHEFTVAPHLNSLAFFLPVKDLLGHTGSFHSQGWEKGMTSILFDWEGNQLNKYEPSYMINVSLQELLSAAYYDEVEELGPLTLDSVFTRKEMSVVNIPIRLLGTVLTVDIWVTDKGECKVYDTFRDKIKILYVNPGSPTACILVHAERKPTCVETNIPLGTTGGYRSRKTMGVQIKFRMLGTFAFLDEAQLIQNLTVFFVWIQIPLVLTYYFAISFLGNLSAIYTRVIHQDLNVAKACKGYAARLVSHSSSFMDLKNKPAGMTKSQIFYRFAEFLKDMKEVDEDELNKFADFLFEGLKNLGDNGFDRLGMTVSLQEFCTACSSNEPLSLGTLVRLFNKDRKTGIIEGLFLDADIAAVWRATYQPEASRVNVDNHSLVEKAYTGVQEMMKKLADAEVKVKKAGKDLEVEEEINSLFAGLDDAPEAAMLLPPKRDQDADNISVADEEELGTDPQELAGRM